MRQFTVLQGCLECPSSRVGIDTVYLRGYVGIYRGFIGLMEKIMESTIMGVISGLGFRKSWNMILGQDR